MPQKPTYEELMQRIKDLELEIDKQKKLANLNKDQLLNYFKIAVENSADAVGMATSKGEHWYQNKAFDDLFGEIGTDPRKTLFLDKKVGEEVFKTIMAGDQWTGEVLMYGKNKDMLHILLRAYAIKDQQGHVIGLVGIHTDITEQKRAQKQIAESDRKYKALVDNTPDLLYRTDIHGIITFISSSVYRLSGYMVEEAIGMQMAEEVYANPEERQQFLELMTKNGYVENFQALLKRKDGSTWWASTNAHFYKDEKGNVIGVEGITRDISAQKKAQEDKIAWEAQLHREEKMKSLGLMAGGIAHDLNNILSGIVSYPDLILMDLPQDSPLCKPIETIRDSGQRAADVVSDLLTIARGVTTGKQILNLNRLIEEYLKSAEHRLIEQHNPLLNIDFNQEAKLLNIDCSPIHIKKILLNLVTNAAEAITGSGHVVIQTQNIYLDYNIKGYDNIRKGEYVLLTISDDGSGIPPENLERIFEPFYTKKVMGKSGTGLGLAVVWNAVQDHNGYIDVKSDDTGTTFKLYFQVTRQALTNQKASVPIEEIRGNGQNIDCR